MSYESILAALIGLYIAYTAFCRARVMTDQTERSIRVAFAVMGACGLAVAMGEVAMLMKVNQWWVSFRWHALGISFAAMQTITARFWHRGEHPPQFLTRTKP